MAEFEYTPREDARYDHLTDVENKDAHEARSIIELERLELERQQRRDAEVRSLGVDAAARVMQAPVPESTPSLEGERPTVIVSHPANQSERKIHYSNGKIRDADSALDPYWNVSTVHDPDSETPEAKEAREKFLHEAHEAAVHALVESGLTQIEAEARQRAHYEINHRY